MRTDLKPAAGTDQGNDNTTTGPRHPQIWVIIALLGMLAVLFHDAFRRGYVMFSNDGPLGFLTAEMNRLPGCVKGLWQDQNWLGSDCIAPPVSVSSLLRFLLPPLDFAKFIDPIAILIAGLGAFFCFRRMKLSPWACILGALAAAMNSDFFSTSCWGVYAQVVGFGAMFVALGFLAEPQAKWSWLRVVLAGMAVGVGVMEAYDIGAMFSLFVAAYVVYQTLFLTAKVEPAPVKIGRSALRTGIVAVFAGLIATHTLTGLVGTQITGIAGAQQDEQVKAMEWMQKTAWSVPTPELFQVLVPGVFGYRMIWHMYENDQPKDDRYWGSAPTPVGTGYYAGVLVVLVALWALLQSMRTRGSPFTIFQRRAIWFWALVVVVTALLAIGKNAPFYQFLYQLPYFSTIRNPQKFMHVFSWALVIVFAYGVHGLSVAYMQKPVALAGGAVAQFKAWRAKAQPFERWWFNGSVWAIIVSVLSLMIYASSNSTIQQHIKDHGIDPQAAPGIADFSVHALGWFVVLFVVATALLALVCSGQFSGARSRWGGLLLGAFLLLDLGRADAPWIVFWDTSYKYASDPIVTFLADKPYEHRVGMLPIQISAQVLEPLQKNAPDQYNAWIQQLSLLQNAYGSGWKQNLFPYHDIQCIDDIQEPRAGVDKRELQAALPPNTFFNILRWWQLSNTRYLLGPGPQVIHALDPTGKFFRVVKGFDLGPKRPNANFMATEDWVSVENTNGHLSVTELVDALPRAKLFTKWQVNPDNDATLRELASGQFDPRQVVLVSNSIPAANSANADKDPGTVEINKYLSRRVEMQADVKVPSVLMLTDRYNSKWFAWVDGKPVDMLQCDFITRGVYLEPGKHTIVMRYIEPGGTLYVSLAVIAVGLLLWGFVAFNSPVEETVEAAACPVPAPAEAKK